MHYIDTVHSEVLEELHAWKICSKTEVWNAIWGAWLVKNTNM